MVLEDLHSTPFCTTFCAATDSSCPNNQSLAAPIAWPAMASGEGHHEGAAVATPSKGRSDRYLMITRCIAVMKEKKRKEGDRGR